MSVQVPFIGAAHDSKDIDGSGTNNYENHQ